MTHLTCEKAPTLDGKPETIAAIVRLPNGDDLQATAFRTGTTADGLTQYEVALTDGSPFTFTDAATVRLWLEQIPPRSSVILRVAV